jgi:gluconokinase
MNCFVIMGVSGCGKTTVARALADRTGGVFLDADDFHPPENKQKMTAGIPLTDDDRRDWLTALNRELRSRSHQNQPVFLACSALRESHRRRIADAVPGLQFIHLRGSRECIANRLAGRTGHFMSPSLLESQFATLEEPSDAITVDIDGPMDALIEDLLLKLPPSVAKQRSAP